MKNKKWWEKWRDEKQESVEWWENHTIKIANELARTMERLQEQRSGLAEIDVQIAELENPVCDD